GESIDTTSAQGRFFFSIIASFAELERELISERTKFSLKALKESGIKLGKPAWSDKDQIIRAKKAYEMHKTMKIQPICDELGISRVTFYKYIKWAENQGID
ncbi:MAG: recombinase family protein, partial [Candidatus Delongbacteria bacterium]|nr:recombinase family protein [Candidatus Delongbacteria bacterium]